MEDIEAFSAMYRAKLDEAEIAKSIPENTSLEVFTFKSDHSLFLCGSFALFVYARRGIALSKMRQNMVNELLLLIRAYWTC